MKYTIVSICLLIAQTNSCLFGKIDSNKVKKIAHQMSVIGPECRYLSSKEMKKRRLLFLNNNKDATIAELVQAIDMPVNGHDIVTLLKSFQCKVCNEYAASIAHDRSRGVWALEHGKGETTVETLLWWGFL